jgi:hypothetical protein
MASLKFYVNQTPFEGKKTTVVVTDLSDENVARMLPVVNEVVLGIKPPVPSPASIMISPFSTDLDMLRMVVTQTYVAVAGGLSTTPNKINMIKFVRSVTNMGLKDAKDFVDQAEASARLYRRPAA